MENSTYREQQVENKDHRQQTNCTYILQVLRITLLIVNNWMQIQTPINKLPQMQRTGIVFAVTVTTLVTSQL